MDLSEVRVNIDRVDNEIKKLFEERMHLSDCVARCKAETEDAIYKPDREVEIIERLTTGVDPSIKMEYKALIKRIMEVSRKYQYGRTLELRNCLDVSYVDSMPEIKKYVIEKRDEDILKHIDKKNVDTVEGMDNLLKCVLEDEETAGLGIMEDIGYSVSDEMHKIICDNPLYINECRIIPSIENGIEHKKKLIKFTRNLVVRPEDNRLKIMFVCENRSGSLASVLSMIADYGINLAEIHSKADEKEIWNYVFIAELKCSFVKKETKALIFQLMNETDVFKIMGSYYIPDEG
ncbi:MAG: chorismate mutase [Eubacterium sp.]|nr:chorismate mutase [Eubacterium sp.]